jgi:acyl-CoA thioesterase-1
MIRWILVAGLLAPVAARADAEPVVLVLGDSLSAGYGLTRESGWVQLLAERISDLGFPHRVVNASVSGDTTAGGLTRLPPLLAEHRPSVLIIELGANDGLRGIAFEEIDANLTRLVRLGKESDARVLILGNRLPPNYGAAYADRFQALFGSVAGREQVSLVTRLLAGVAENWDLVGALDQLWQAAHASNRHRA